MPYATQQNLVDRLPDGLRELIQLSDRATPPTGVVDVNVVSQALTGADALINSALAVKYSLPLASVPLMLVEVASDISIFKLYGKRAPAFVVDRYEDAVEWLDGVAKGTRSLGLNQANQTTPPTVGEVQIAAADRVFTRDSLADY